MYRYFNPNPKGIDTTDCVIRMLCKIFNLDWVSSYLILSEIAIREYMMPSDNYIWETFLTENGFTKRLLPHCPNCITIRDFANIYNDGIYVACTGSHVVAVIFGEYYDAWDSGSYVVSYYFEERR